MMGKAAHSDQLPSLTYKLFGNGDKTILAFHGFGHPKENFDIILPFLTGNERIIAVDLFGHGEAYFPENRLKNNPISKQEWWNLIDVILKKENVNRFSLMGYSLGGRMAMVTLEHFHTRVDRILLFSPDGLHKNLSYRLANEIGIGRRLFRWGIRHAQKLHPVITFLHKTGLTPKSRTKFILRQIEDPKKIEMARYVWGSLSLCWPDLQAIFKKLDPATPFVVVFGQHDPLIKPSYGRSLHPYMQSHIHQFIIPIGHRTIAKEGFEILMKKGYWPI
ncbi:MAG: alpha/beta fold hydrolase [Flavobacteriales bacterium]